MGVPPPPPGTEYYNAYEVDTPGGSRKSAKGRDFVAAWTAYVYAIRALRTALGLNGVVKFRGNFATKSTKLGKKVRGRRKK